MQRKLPLRKARDLNESKAILGTIAEIGAGQEVARTFFMAGQASNTVAKTMSAYSKEVSDDVYLEGLPYAGIIPYASRFRLMAMLEHEHYLLTKRFIINQRTRKEIMSVRGNFPLLFSFANTVSSSEAPPGRRQDSNGWLGVRILASDKSITGTKTDASKYVDLLAHIALIEQSKAGQYDTVGALGVNMIEAAYRIISKLPSGASSKYVFPDSELVESMLDGISKWKVRLDVLEVNPSKSLLRDYSPYFQDNAKRAIHITRSGLTHEAIACRSYYHTPAQIYDSRKGKQWGVDHETFRASLDEWIKQHPVLHSRGDGAIAEDWAYPNGNIREPVRFFRNRSPIVVFELQQSKKGLTPTKSISEALVSLIGKDRDEKMLPLGIVSAGLLTPSSAEQGRQQAEIEVGLEEELTRLIAQYPSYGFVVSRLYELSAAMESLTRSNVSGSRMQLLLDWDRWREIILECDFGRIRREVSKIIEDLEHPSSEVSKGLDARTRIAMLDEYRVALACTSESAVHFLQRIERTNCTVSLCIGDKYLLNSLTEAGPDDYADLLSAGSDKETKAYISYLLISKKLHVFTCN